MPQFYNNTTTVCVTPTELVEAGLYSSIDYLYRLLSEHKKRGYGLRKIDDGRKTGVALIDYDSLPTEKRNSLVDPRKYVHVMIPYYCIDMVAVEFFKTNGYTNDERYELMVTNASVLQAAIRLHSDRLTERKSKNKLSICGLKEALAFDVKTFNSVLLAQYSVQHSLPEEWRSLDRKIKEFDGKNYDCLIHKGTHKQSNNLKVTDRTIELLRSMFAGTTKKPNYADVRGLWDGFLGGYVQVVNPVTSEVYRPSEFKPLSRTRIYDLLSEWDSKIGTDAARSGDRQKLMEQYSTPAKNAPVEKSGSIISVDDRQPPFWYEKGKRMWFYLGQDVASKAIVTWVWGKKKEHLIIDFYRQMVRLHAQWGVRLPYELECESSLNSTLRDGLLKDGCMFPIVKMEANKARAKYIESGYNRQTRYHAEKDREGWIGRPHAKDESNQNGPDKRPIIPYDTLVLRCLNDIETWNNEPHPIVKNKTRWEYFIENQNDKLVPINWKGILKAVGYEEKAIWCRRGIMELNNNTWLIGEDGEMCVGDDLIARMRKIEGKQISIFWLDDSEGNLLKAHVYLQNSYVCELVAQPLTQRARIEQTPETLAARQQMRAYSNTIAEYQKAQSDNIVPVVIIDERKTTLNDKFSIAGKPQKIEHDFKNSDSDFDNAQVNYNDVETDDDSYLHQDDCEDEYVAVYNRISPPKNDLINTF